MHTQLDWAEYWVLGLWSLFALEELEKYMAQFDKVRAGEAGPIDPAPAARIRFPDLLVVLAKRRSFVFKFMVVAPTLAVVLSLLQRNTYTAEVMIMPPQQSQSMSTTGMIVTQPGALTALAGQVLGMRTPSDLYVSMLRSETVADAIIDRYSLMRVYNSKRRVDARKELEYHTLIVAEKNGMISISVADSQSHYFSSSGAGIASRQRAADIANAYVEELEKLTKTLAVTEAARRRAFFDRETKIATDDLANAEQALKETQEKTGLILPDSQSRAMLNGLASLRGRVAAQEVVVQSMGSFATKENPDLIRAEQQLSAMKEQVARLERGQGNAFNGELPIENVPTAGLEYVRKFREVKYREGLFEALAKQYEAAKIDEARDAVILPLEKAIAPEKKSGPPRAILVLSMTLLAFPVATLAALFMEKLEHAKDKPAVLVHQTNLRPQKQNG